MRCRKNSGSSRKQFKGKHSLNGSKALIRDFASISRKLIPKISLRANFRRKLATKLRLIDAWKISLTKWSGQNVRTT